MGDHVDELGLQLLDMLHLADVSKHGDSAQHLARPLVDHGRAVGQNPAAFVQVGKLYLSRDTLARLIDLPDRLEELCRLDHLSELADLSRLADVGQDPQSTRIMEDQYLLRVADEDRVPHAVDDRLQPALLGCQLEQPALAVGGEPVSLADQAGALKRAVHYAKQLGGREGLREEVEGVALRGLHGGLERRVGGDDDTHHLGRELLRQGQELEAPHARHTEVDERDVDVPLLPQRLQPGLGGLGKHHLVALGPQDSAATLANADFVIDDEDPMGTRFESLEWRARSRSRYLKRHAEPPAG